MEKNYYIGLDIGTNSCGWAVTDENYNILKAKGKKMWGVRLFEEAKTAEERRMKRTARRRLERKKLKLSWLQEIFSNEIAKVDPFMLERVRFSSLWEDDKRKMCVGLKSKDSLFNGELNGQKFTDKEYFDKYPTIYHLRKELTEKPAEDIRFLYLALHNIIKRSGHFLFEGDLSDNSSLEELIREFMTLFNEVEIENFACLHFDNIDSNFEDKILDCLKNKSGIKQLKANFVEILGAKIKLEKSISNCLVDGKINLADIFGIETENSLKIDFNSEDFEQVFDSIKTQLEGNQISLVEKLKQIYSVLQLKKILGEFDYISQAMVELYNTHKQQLKYFKNFIKKYYPNSYHRVFRKAQTNKNDKDTNYALYVKGSIFDNQKRVVDLKYNVRDKQEFYKFVKNIIEDKNVEILDECINEYNEQKNTILNWIETDNFLNKQRTKNNNVFPNKLYIREVEKILEVNSTKYPFLNEKDSLGLTNSQKILSILKFKIPYFVGPLGCDNNSKGYGWVQRDKTIDLKPWNLEKMIDLDDAEDKFILRMTNKCTYLTNKDVLPKHSIEYARFRVLNELNKLRINGQAISVNLKQEIMSNLFECNAKVTAKRLKDYLVAKNYIEASEIKNIEISGIDKEFANNCAYYSRLINSANFSKEFVDKNIDMFEKIIKYQTIISDKNRLEIRLKREFSSLLNEAQIKELKSITVQGWGSLSYEFLRGLSFVNKQTGEVTCIMQELWQTNQNLQEILYNDIYTLKEELDNQTKKNTNDIVYTDVEALQCSPAVKRGVWQTIKIIKEIIELCGKNPSKIFVEVTRHDEEKGDKGRKLSRQTNLLNMYQSKEFITAVKNTAIEVEDLIEELTGKNNLDLRNDKLYLYFMQLGRCAYSEEKIDLQDLILNENMYDIDHIIPQSKIKDDSMNNRVLVKSVLNKEKSDTYPLNPDWIMKRKGFWGLLLKLKLMQKEKYDRLTRLDDITDDELGNFIARQIVETNQTNKAVIELLKSVSGNQTKIVYSKASIVSDFRNKYKIPKSRTVNDLHHAKDAYLNIVIGNVLHNRFTEDPRNFYKNKADHNKHITKNIKRIFDYNIMSSNGKDSVWNPAVDIERVKSICEKNDCLVTRMSYTKLNGQFYNETKYKSEKNDSSSQGRFELKGDSLNPISNPARYGGYDSLSSAYFCVIEGEKKGSLVKQIEAVPTIIIQKYKNDEDKDKKIEEFICSQSGLENAKIVIPRLNIQSTLLIGSGIYILASKTGYQINLYNANQLRVTQEETFYVKAIEKYLEYKLSKRVSHLVEEENKVILSKKSKEGNIEIVLTKDKNEWLYENIIQKLSAKAYQGLALGTTLYNELIDKREVFKTLSVLNQAECLGCILKGISTNAMSADLLLLGGSKNTAVIRINKNITGKKIYLLEQSSTGLYEKRIRL